MDRWLSGLKQMSTKHPCLISTTGSNPVLSANFRTHKCFITLVGFLFIFIVMDILADTFERHKQLLFESLYDNWEDRVDWTPIITLYGSDSASTKSIETILNDEEGKIVVDNRPTEQFWLMYNALPPKVQRIAKESYELFRVDPYNIRLRFHRLKQGHETYAVNVGGSYRAIGIKQPSNPPYIFGMKWIWIGYHGNYDDELHRIKKKKS